MSPEKIKEQWTMEQRNSSHRSDVHAQVQEGNADDTKLETRTAHPPHLPDWCPQRNGIRGSDIDFDSTTTCSRLDSATISCPDSETYGRQTARISDAYGSPVYLSLWKARTKPDHDRWAFREFRFAVVRCYTGEELYLHMKT